MEATYRCCFLLWNENDVRVVKSLEVYMYVPKSICMLFIIACLPELHTCIIFDLATETFLLANWCNW